MIRQGRGREDRKEKCKEREGREKRIGKRGRGGAGQGRCTYMQAKQRRSREVWFDVVPWSGQKLVQLHTYIHSYIHSYIHTYALVSHFIHLPFFIMNL